LSSRQASAHAIKAAAMAAATPRRTIHRDPPAAAAAPTVPVIKTTSEMRWSGEGLSPRLALAGEVTLATILLGLLTAVDFNSQS
jgi:hypothetical protein